MLPGLLLAAGLMDLVTGQWGQVTVSGFAVFTAGLCLASGEGAGAESEEEIEEVRQPRGRGVYAETIKGGRS